MHAQGTPSPSAARHARPGPSAGTIQTTTAIPPTTRSGGHEDQAPLLGQDRGAARRERPAAEAPPHACETVGVEDAFGTVLVVVVARRRARRRRDALTSGRAVRPDRPRRPVAARRHDRPRPSRRRALARGAERDEEIRQMLEARNARRVRQGKAPLDVEAELARLTGRRPPTRPCEAEVRQLVVARNDRRARQGKPPLDVEAEVERQLRGPRRACSVRAADRVEPRFPMPALRRFELDDLLTRPGTYFNPDTEVLLVVDDAACSTPTSSRTTATRATGCCSATTSDRRERARRAHRALRGPPPPGGTTGAVAADEDDELEPTRSSSPTRTRTRLSAARSARRSAAPCGSRRSATHGGGDPDREAHDDDAARLTTGPMWTTSSIRSLTATMRQHDRDRLVEVAEAPDQLLDEREERAQPEQGEGVGGPDREGVRRDREGRRDRVDREGDVRGHDRSRARAAAAWRPAGRRVGEEVRPVVVVADREDAPHERARRGPGRGRCRRPRRAGSARPGRAAGRRARR